MLTAPKTWTSGPSRSPTGARTACPICGSGEPAVFDDTRPQTMLICRSCRHLFWDRTPTPDELRKHYSEQYSEQHGQQALQQSIRDYYRSHIAELARVLGNPPADLCLVDYGSSIPVLVHEAAAAGFGRAVAVDYDAASFAYAREHGLEIVTPPEYERWPDAVADVIRFSHVLEHMPDPVAAVATAVAKLRPGGLLYITQPSFPLYQPDTTRYQLRDSVYPTHLQFFTPLSLKRMLERFPVRVRQFYTHTASDETMRDTAESLDLDLSRVELADWSGIGQAVRGELCNYPYYAGANSELWAFKSDTDSYPSSPQTRDTKGLDMPTNTYNVPTAPGAQAGDRSEPRDESLSSVLRRLPAGQVSFPDDAVPVSDEEARRLVGAAQWYHRFELRPGIVTPGHSDFHPGPVCDYLGVPADLTGRRVMDIGTWDGPLAFELERRGGDCVALDIQDPERVGFAVARRVSGSRVPHVRASVYDLEKLGLRDFDHIVFKGVFYHLKHPILAFEQISKALKVGGRVSIEGETPLNHIEDIDGRKVDLDLRRLNELRVPACFTYPNRFKGGSNWFIPNLPCMESWLRACGMKVVSMQTWESDVPPHGGQRLIGVAERVAERVGEVEHPLY